MNEIIDRLLELPTRQRVLVIVAGVGVIFSLYWYFAYGPRSKEIAKLQNQLNTVQQERDRKAELAANLADARQQVADLQAALKEAMAQLPDTKEIPNLLSDISGEGRRSGLEIVQFRQRPEQLHDFYAEVPVEMLVRGSYFQVEGFFERVSRLERIVNMRNISIKSPDKIPEDPVRLETSCAATTFRFLNEEERERVKAEREAKKKGGKRGRRKRRGH